MAQTIRMAAILARDGRLFLMRRDPAGEWELPGGPLQSHHDDVDAGMGVILGEFGVEADDLSTDFVETVYMRDEADAHVVYNIYAPRGWSGEPTMAPGIGAGWFAFDELDAVRMDDRVRQSVLVAFGLAEPVDDSAAIMAAFGRVMGSGEDEEVAAPEARVSARSGSLSVATATALRIGILAALGQRKALRRAVEDAVDAGIPDEAMVATIQMVSLYAGLPVGEDAGEVVRMVLGSRGLPVPEGLA